MTVCSNSDVSGSNYGGSSLDELFKIVSWCLDLSMTEARSINVNFQVSGKSASGKPKSRVHTLVCSFMAECLRTTFPLITSQ